jgi:hypothetical protein
MPRARRQTRRCSFVDGQGRRCRRIGFGDPPLCRSCAISIEAELEDSDPLAAVLDQIDRLFSRKAARASPEARAAVDFLSDFISDVDRRTQYQEQFVRWANGVRRGFAGGAPGRPPRSFVPPPPPPPPPPPEPQVDEREMQARLVLGFAPRMRLGEALIKARKRELALRYHPDRQCTPQAQAQAQRKMSEINAAADYLIRTL